VLQQKGALPHAQSSVSRSPLVLCCAALLGAGLRSLRLTCEDQGESIPTDNSECYKLGKCLSGLTHLQELHIGG
jgi:hypothetical protein